MEQLFVLFVTIAIIGIVFTFGGILADVLAWLWERWKNNSTTFPMDRPCGGRG